MHVSYYVEQSGNDTPDLTVIIMDGETKISVLGFGHGDYRWRVDNIRRGENPEYQPMEAVIEWFATSDTPAVESDEAGFYPGMQTLGRTMVCVEPVTFAYGLRDMLANI